MVNAEYNSSLIRDKIECRCTTWWNCKKVNIQRNSLHTLLSSATARMDMPVVLRNQPGEFTVGWQCCCQGGYRPNHGSSFCLGKSGRATICIQGLSPMAVCRHGCGPFPRKPTRGVCCRLALLLLGWFLTGLWWYFCLL